MMRNGQAPRINTSGFTHTSPEIVESTLARTSLDKGRVEREAMDLDHALHKIYAQAEGPDKSVNLMRVDSADLSGNERERYFGLVDLHSQLAAKQERLSEIASMERGAEEVLRPRAPEPEYEEPAQPQIVAGDFAEEIFRTMRAQGYAGSDMFARASAEKRAFNFDMHRHMAATFKLASTDVQPRRLDEIVPIIQRPVQILDVIAVRRTDREKIEYLEETTRTPNITAVAEEADLTGSTYAFTKKEVTVKRLGAHLPITREAMEDAPMIEDYIRMDFPRALRQTLDAQIMTGTGSGANLEGLVTLGEKAGSGAELTRVGANASGENAKVTSGADDAVNRKVLEAALTARRNVKIKGRSMPSYYALDSAIWTNLQRAKDGQSRYYGEGPFRSQGAMLWGLPVLETEHFAAGVDKVCGFAFSVEWIKFLVRRDGVVDMGYIANQFIEDTITLRISGRYGFYVERVKSIGYMQRPQQ